VKQVSLLIKPASSNCNMRCDYCFYFDETVKRAVGSFGLMSRETIEAIVRKSWSTRRKAARSGFQGGEPMLAGHEFFQGCRRTAATIQPKKPDGRQRPCRPNGTLVNDDEWAAFLAENRFLVGVSLDGPSGAPQPVPQVTPGGPARSTASCAASARSSKAVPIQHSHRRHRADGQAHSGNLLFFMARRGSFTSKTFRAWSPLAKGRADGVTRFRPKATAFSARAVRSVVP
jgi:hypothetical protein